MRTAGESEKKSDVSDLSLETSSFSMRAGSTHPCGRSRRAQDATLATSDARTDGNAIMADEEKIPQMWRKNAGVRQSWTRTCAVSKNDSTYKICDKIVNTDDYDL